MRWSRRRLLVAATLGAAAASVGGFAWLGRPASGMRALSPMELRVVRALAEALFPAGGPIGVDPLAVGTVEEVDRILADVFEPEAARAFRYLLRTLELGTLLSRGLPFTALAPAERLDVLRVWNGKEPLPRRLAMDSIRSVFGMAYFSRPQVLAAIGWRDLCPVR